MSKPPSDSQPAEPVADFRIGETVHARLLPFRHVFSYRLFMLRLDIDRIAEAAAPLRCFSWNRPNLMAFYDRDHGSGADVPLRGFVEDLLRRAGEAPPGGRIDLYTFPRVLGYVFSPISVFVAHDGAGVPRAALYEVNNTFGDRHCYAAALARRADAAERTGVFRHVSAKTFYVSPFQKVEGEYDFRLILRHGLFALRVTNRRCGPDGKTQIGHIATLRLAQRPLTDGAILRMLVALPFMTLGVISAIHWQALKLWLKGAQYVRRPRPPAFPVTAAVAVPEGPKEPRPVDHVHRDASAS